MYREALLSLDLLHAAVKAYESFTFAMAVSAAGQ
jgi:hypothetical protein